MLSPLKEAHYIDRKVDINSYMIFAPVFFANIGINTDFTGFNGTVLLFSLLFVLVGVLGKIIGCGGVAKLCKFSWRESGQIGVGMIARGEVALAVYATGQSLICYENGILTGIDPLVATIFLIVLSSVLCPILLKLCFRSHNGEQNAQGERRATIASEALENVMHEDMTTAKVASH